MLFAQIAMVDALCKKADVAGGSTLNKPNNLTQTRKTRGVTQMPFPDLQTLLQASSSSRQFLLSLPVDVQLQLHEQNDWIHTQADLRRYAAYYHD